MTTVTDTAAVRAAFLADIIEHPDDDAVRLIFADWLEDHGETRLARFIRSQIAGEYAALTLAVWSKACEAFPRDNRTAGKLESGRGVATWTRGDIVVTWRRGFVHAVHLPADIWLQHRVELVRRHPIERVELVGFTPYAWGDDRRLGKRVRGKVSWFVNARTRDNPHHVTTDLTGVVPEEGLVGLAWSTHDDAEQANDWLSRRLIKRAKELTKESSRDQ